MALCEDYPCCGHENASCNDNTDYAEVYTRQMAKYDFDPYYEPQEWN